MTIIFYLFGFLFLFIDCFSAPIKYLLKHQWISIHNLILHPGTTPDMRNDINKLLYSRFEDWAIRKTYNFKQKHSYTCRNINIKELGIYSCNSLNNAIVNYKPREIHNDTSQFLNYVGKCIDGGLYTGLTELYPISMLPKNMRKQKRTIKTKYLYKNMLDTIFLSNDDVTQQSNTYLKKDIDSLFSKYEYIEI